MNIHEARIYVGTYRKYNEGSIEGDWLDVADYSDKDEFMEAARELHADEEDPELMFQDYENIPGSLAGESFIKEELWELIDATRDWDSDRLDALFIYFNDQGADDMGADAIPDFEEAYLGHFDGDNPIKEYAYQFIDECYDLDKMMGNLSSYFDYDAYARDLRLGGDVWESEGHVFRNN